MSRNPVTVEASYQPQNLDLDRNYQYNLRQFEKKFEVIDMKVNIIFGILIFLFIAMIIWAIVAYTQNPNPSPSPSACSNSNPNGVCSNAGTLCTLGVGGNYECIRRCDLGFDFPCPDGTTCTSSDGKEVCLPFL